MRLALEVWGDDAEQVLATAVRADELGFDALYYGEAPHGLNLDCWTMLAALARSTTRIRLGPVITNILPTWRSTALLADQAATVARLSGGRLDFRTGVGAAAPFGRAWWGPSGVDYPDYATRLADLTRALPALRQRWTTVTGPGSAVPPIPVTLAATGRRALELAAAQADTWETSFCTPAEVADRIATMADLTAGRPPAPADPTALTAGGPQTMADTTAGRPSTVADLTAGGRPAVSLEIDGFVGPDAGAAERLLDRVRADRGGSEDLTPVLARALTGPPEVVAGQIRALAAAGVEQLVVALHDPHDPAALDSLAAAARLV